jgi:hypothetical protein
VKKKTTKALEPTRRKGMKILVIDVGGTNLKLLATDQEDVRKLPSGPDLTPSAMIQAVKEGVKDWSFEAISIGFPAPIVGGKLLLPPVNLGPGWPDVDFAKEFGCPVKLINDALMQALGSYESGRMLFLGLGTGLGSAMIADNVLIPLELAHLPFKKGRSFEDCVGEKALKLDGKKKWEKVVFEVVELLRRALVAETVVLGGGNVKKLTTLPEGVRAGDNRNAIIGGFRLWQKDYRLP